MKKPTHDEKATHTFCTCVQLCQVKTLEISKVYTDKPTTLLVLLVYEMWNKLLFIIDTFN